MNMEYWQFNPKSDNVKPKNSMLSVSVEELDKNIKDANAWLKNFSRYTKKKRKRR